MNYISIGRVYRLMKKLQFPKMLFILLLKLQYCSIHSSFLTVCTIYTVKYHTPFYILP